MNKVKKAFYLQPRWLIFCDAGDRKQFFKVGVTKCISEIGNKQVDNAQEIGVVMPMFNLIEYSDNYSKTSRSLWEYYRD